MGVAPLWSLDFAVSLFHRGADDPNREYVGFVHQRFAVIASN